MMLFIGRASCSSRREKEVGGLRYLLETPAMQEVFLGDIRHRGGLRRVQV